MADEKHGGWGGGWDRSHDSDHRPGNEWESRDYSRRFDPRSEQEYTSSFLETPDQLRKAAIEQSWQDQMRQERLDAQHAVHFWPSVGKFIIPDANTWAAHAHLVNSEKNNLYFNPEKYLFFDKIIAQKFPAITQDKYKTLRANLAVLRNDVIGIYMEDGSFDPGDEIHIPKLVGIAAAIGDALANDTLVRRQFARSFSRDVANVEGVGAAELYKFLQRHQQKPWALAPLVANVKTLLHMETRDWGLPPLDKTPFSPENLSAPLPAVSEEQRDARGNFVKRLLEERGQNPTPSLA